MNIFSILRDAAGKRGHGSAIVHNGRRFAVSDLYYGAESLATRLSEAGIVPGDKVGLMCQEGPEYITAFFSICRAGGVVVPLSAAYKATEIHNLAAETCLDAFCFSTRAKPLIPEDSDGETVQLPVFQHSPPLWIRRSATHDKSSQERDRLRGINAASIRFSSGTTSKAKGIVLSHESILERLGAKCEAVPTKADDTILYLLSTGRSVPTRLLVCLSEGAKIVMADAMNTAGIPETVERHGVTQIFAVPLFYQTILHEPALDVRRFRAVRRFFSTASSLPGATAEAFSVRFGREIIQYYTLGEVGSPLANFGDLPGKRGSAGIPAGDYQIKLVPQNAEPTREDERGEIYVRGPGMFDAYYKPWRVREEVLENGWFRTGDLARRDPDGYYWIEGRLKEVINVGGVKVFPYDIETLLLGHPAVEDAVVYGMGEARFGEVPHARVKLRAGMSCDRKELLRYVNEQLSVFKALRGLEFVDEIGKTVTGKTRRWV